MRDTAADAHKKRGGQPAGRRPVQQKDNAMLKVASSNTEGNDQKATPPKHHTVSSVRKASLWIDEQVRKAGRSVISIKVELTPDLAAALLDRNEGNRKAKIKKIEEYARDILNGAWKLNGSSLVVSDNGRLNDGQNRCHAVIKTGRSIQTILTFGVERDTRDTLDQGAVRTVGDYLSFDGVSEANNVAAAATCLWQYERFGFISRSPVHRPTKSETLATAHANPGLQSAIRFVRRPRVNKLASISVLAFCYFAIRRFGVPEDVDAFFDKFLDGTDLKSGDPILTARTRLIGEGRGLLPAARAEIIFKAWNAHRQGLHRVRYVVSGGELPLVEA